MQGPSTESFRDPNGRVLIRNGRVFRVLSSRGRCRFEAVTRSGLFEALQSRMWIQPFTEAEGEAGDEIPFGSAKVLEQEPIPLVTYPYEWSFSLLKEAALRHLDIQLLALEHGIALSDASAFNIQFVGTNPAIIDISSFQPYQEGEYWLGHQQFLDQFLNPLLLTSWLGVPFSAWFRGSIRGIPTVDLQRLVPLHKRLSWRVLANVELPAYFQRREIKGQRLVETVPKRSQLPRAAYRAILLGLREWIATIEFRTQASIWSGYEKDHTYSDLEHQAKHAFVSEFISRFRPYIVWDLGCNRGEYAEIAIASGASRLFGFDSDMLVLESAFKRARQRKLDFLPLYLDASNQSPNQGWNQSELRGLQERINADAILALAFLHHLVIGSTIPMRAAISWLIGLASCGIIEFVAKTDSTVQRMLAMREDIFPDYTEQEFESILCEKAWILKKQVIKGGTRILYAFQRL
jgi:ribosomal protein L11 methylase PrmA